MKRTACGRRQKSKDGQRALSAEQGSTAWGGPNHALERGEGGVAIEAQCARWYSVIRSLVVNPLRIVFGAPEKFIWGWGALRSPFPTPPPHLGGRGSKGRLSFFHVLHAYSMTKALALSRCVPVPVTVTVTVSLQRGGGGSSYGCQPFYYILAPPPNKQSGAKIFRDLQ